MQSAMAGMITHFSHREHVLTAMAADVSVPCSVCKRSKCTAKGFYACMTCQYFLGFVCAMLEEKIHIWAHEQHPLTLVTTPATGNVPIMCRACGGRILGWRYSCSYRCGYDLHAACAHWPKTIETPAVHVHPLALLHFPAGPQPRRDGVNCKGCGHGDKGLWGYGCSTCGSGFFQHLDCAAAIALVASENLRQFDIGEAVDVATGIGNNDWDGAAVDGPDSLWRLFDLLVPDRFSAPISLMQSIQTQFLYPDPSPIVYSTSATAQSSAPAIDETSSDDGCDCDCENICCVLGCCAMVGCSIS